MSTVKNLQAGGRVEDIFAEIKLHVFVKTLG